MDTTTTLTEDLHQALTAAGLTPRRATRITRLIPPAGQHTLLKALTADPQHTFPRLLHAWIGEVADLLRCTYADAGTVRRAFRTAVTR